MLHSSINVNDLRAENGKRIAFYHVMEGTPKGKYGSSSPSTLQFVAWLEKMGHKVDYYIFGSELERGVASKKYDVVAISAAEPNFKSVYDTSARIKEIDPGVIVAVGGYVTSGVGNILVQHPAIDAAFEGEAEYTFPLFLRHASRSDGNGLAVPSSEFYGFDVGEFPFKTYYKSPVDHETAGRIMSSTFRRTVEGEEVEVPISNVHIRVDDGSVYFPSSQGAGLVYSTAPLAAELDALQDLPWWTVYSEHQSSGLFRDVFSTQGSALNWKDVWMYVQRGCAGNKGEPCGFCSIPYKVRFPGVDASLDAVERTVKTFEHQEPPRMPDYIRFGDESFTQNREWVLEFINGLRKRGLSPLLGYSMQCRVVDGFHGGRVDKELLDALAEAHFDQATGIETLHPATVEYINKVSEGKGRKYVEMAHEYVIESLKRNIPTTTYAITAYPLSTIDTIADDYVAWSELVRHAYESTGRVPRIMANIRLTPHKSTKITRDEMDCDVVYAETEKVKKVRNGNVIGEFYPVAPPFSGESPGIFKPSYYLFEPEVMEFLPALEVSCRHSENSSLSDYTDYVAQVGYLLWEYGNAKKRNELKKKGQRIVDNMTFVMDDKNHLRQQRLSEAGKLFYDAFYQGAFYQGKLEPKRGSLNFDERDGNIRRRFEDPYAQLASQGDLERVLDEIASRSPGRLAEYSRTRTGMTDDGFFRSTMQTFYDLLTQYAYNLTQDDINTRLDKARRAVSEIHHASSALFSENHDSQIERMLRDMHEYPLKAKSVRELYENGFPVIWPSGFCLEDPETGVRVFI